MKALLACLLCVVLPAAQCLAVKGGPEYGSGRGSLVGTYAGVMQGVFDPTNPGSSNSIGVFSLGVQEAGLASGRFIMFSRGRAFTGSINAAADPENATLKGLLDARYDYNLQRTQLDEDGNPVVVSIPITSTVNGPIDAKIVAPRQVISAISATRVTGEATLFISGGFVSGTTGEQLIQSVLSLAVSGFKQSTTPIVVAAPTGG